MRRNQGQKRLVSSNLRCQEINLFLSATQLNLQFRWHKNHLFEFRKFCRAFACGQAKVVLQQEEGQGDFELIGGEEATGAGVLTIPESNMITVRRRKLVAVLLTGLLAHAKPAVHVELLGVFVDLGAERAVGTDHESRVGGKDGAV